MLPQIIKWIIIILSFVNSAYMTYDGCRAMITGDYLRPEKGEYAGQLGPWTKLAARVGIDPMSTLMKTIFILFGLAGLVITVCFALDLPWSWKAMLVLNICSAWNLYFGTANSVLQLVLLLILRAIR
jgi:hypothetical protein